MPHNYSGPGNTWAGETWYIYDGNRVIQERNNSDTPTVSYTRGSDLSGTLEGAGGIGGLLGRSDGYVSGNFTSHTYYHADGSGNITYLVNGSQTLAASYRYDPFGNTVSSSGSLASANVYRFSSKEIHPNSGMYYYLYRFYDPNLQRWITRDPIGDRAFGLFEGAEGQPQDLAPNPYRMVDNCPTSRFDPLGLRADPNLDVCFANAVSAYSRRTMNSLGKAAASHMKWTVFSGLLTIGGGALGAALGFITPHALVVEGIVVLNDGALTWALVGEMSKAAKEAKSKLKKDVNDCVAESGNGPDARKKGDALLKRYGAN